MKKSPLRLVVIPTKPISAYERAGYDWLERYFNPMGFFDEVFALSPLEEEDRKAHGMTIRRVPEEKFLDASRVAASRMTRRFSSAAVERSTIAG